MTSWLFIFAFLISSFALAASNDLEVPSKAVAKVQGLILNAENYYQDNDKDEIHLDDKVQIIFNEQHIKANQAIVRLKSKQIELIGNVEVTTLEATIRGAKVILDYESNTGTIYQGLVKTGNILFEGDVLQKVGDREYFVSNAGYTACTNCPESWSFKGSQIRAELGGYAYIKNSILRFGDVPVLWLPYLIVPLASDRQTGLLTPSFESSDRGGLAVTQSFFWAINRNTDTTISLKNYELRGLKGLLNYRYVLAENSFGELDTAFLNDRVFKDDQRLNTFRTNSKGQYVGRWFLKYDHYMELPDGTTHRAQLNNASDLQYPKDFPLETKNHGDPAMENRTSITKNSFDQHLSFETSYYVNLLHSDPLASNEDAVHRLPEIHFAQSPRNIGSSGAYFTFDVNYTNFSRSGKAYDDLTLTTVNGKPLRYVSNNCSDPKFEDSPSCRLLEDGKYDANTDLIRAGQRLDFYPTVYRPFNLGSVFDIVPKLSYRETHYSFPVGQDPSSIRRYLRAEVTGKTSISRVFGDLNELKSTRYKHEVQPEVTVSTIPWLDHRSHPFFGFTTQTDAPNYSKDNVSDGDLGSDYGLQWDYRDRIYDRGLLTFAVLNKLIEKRYIGDEYTYRQILAFKLAQSYDFYQDRQTSGIREPWSDISAVLDVRLDDFETYTTWNYYPYQKVTNSSSRVKFYNDRRQFLQFGLSRQYKIVPGQASDPKDRTEDFLISAGFDSKYVNFLGQFVYDANWVSATTDRRIKSWAYMAEFKPPGDCWIITFIHDQVTGGDTNFRFFFNFSYDGKYKSSVSPEALQR